MKYTLADGDVLILDEDGSVRWRGRLLERPVKVVSPLPDSDEAIALLDYGTTPTKFENLLRLRPDGSIVWRTPLPRTSGTDAFVGFMWDDSQLVANTWSGHRLHIDVETGSVIATEFVK